MDTEENNIKLMRRFFDEVWNQGREESIDELYADEGTAEGLGEEYKGGPEAFKQLHRLLHKTCSDIHIELDDLIAEGGRVALRGKATMTHKVTGKQLEFEGVGFVEIKDGKIVQAWNGWDFMSVIVQLGGMPENGLVQALEGPNVSDPIRI